MPNVAVTRRRVLQGLGTAVALPFFESLSPVFAATGKSPANAVRLAFIYVPNGVHMADWTPKDEGALSDLPSTLKPLADVKSKLSILTGLTHEKANANGDGPGDHARALTSFLTGCQARKTSGSDIHAGISVDQIAANHLAKFTRFPSLELGCDAGAQSGNCDSGYSCAYSCNIAWKSETQPIPKENNPKLVFERLFAGGRPDESAQARTRREKLRKSVLDMVKDDADKLRSQLGQADKRKLEEYLTAVREVEQRVTAAVVHPAVKDSPLANVSGIPDSNQEHMRLMYDLMALAFQTDTTRVSTFVIANEGSNKSYPFIDVPEGHHDLSHHGNDSSKQQKIQKINQYHIEQFAYFLNKLNSIQEGEKTLLDQSMIVYGSGIGDGNAHNHNDLPILLAGLGNGALNSGRHVKYSNGTPLTNLFLSLLDRTAVPCKGIGDSSGRLAQLS